MSTNKLIIGMFIMVLAIIIPIDVASKKVDITPNLQKIGLDVNVTYNLDATPKYTFTKNTLKTTYGSDTIECEIKDVFDCECKDDYFMLISTNTNSYEIRKAYTSDDGNHGYITINKMDRIATLSSYVNEYLTEHDYSDYIIINGNLYRKR